MSTSYGMHRLKKDTCAIHYISIYHSLKLLYSISNIGITACFLDVKNRERLKMAQNQSSISTRLFGLLGTFFLAAGILFIVLLNIEMKRQALIEAESKAQILLDRNLATHTYFSHQLKPKLFQLTDPIAPRNGAPIWERKKLLSSCRRSCLRHIDPCTVSDYLCRNE
jgi:hypothetical protein